MSYSAKVISGGKIVIPAELRRELGIKDGDTLVIERDMSGSLVLKSYLQVVRDVQAKIRAAVGHDYSVDQFLAERRAMWGEAD
ncbi:AbrB/MazE/SpoVT family DNA-binding domain-containing protein [Sphingobium sp. Z007]|uniref:AbrB/MazE/SpoVT family DNA-binding domain-containing protein n=1 Tax=Sphingobium sp. Z007 TaxID=627495 RepID=UPI000B4A53F0|nr:AbrB/MazE/SpoVT family DNA-binding domain-containing protein [Sphingobium sp. Z007]